MKSKDKDKCGIMLVSYTKFYWATLIIKRSNGRHTPVLVQLYGEKRLVHKDSKTKKINLKNNFFGDFSKSSPGECCYVAACKVSLR